MKYTTVNILDNEKINKQMEDATVNIGAFILEDDVDIHELFIDVLKVAGLEKYHIHDNPEDFLEDLNSDINICVIDHFLQSGFTGFDVLKKVREKNKWSFVIIMSGQHSKEIIVDYLNAGADKYIDKSNKGIEEYMQDLTTKLLTGIEVAKERIKVVKLLEATKNIL